MKIVVGLGNPTDKYAGTRHNVGFSVIDELADKYNISMEGKKHKAIYGQGVIDGVKVILVKPQTFMNLSGESVREFYDYYKVDIEDIIVVYDDINLDVGGLRIRIKGSAGGHNGMKNIISHLNGDTFPRVRVGVGEKPKNYDLADWVLSRFPKADLPLIRDGVDNAVKAVAMIVNDDITNAMNVYNGKRK